MIEVRCPKCNRLLLKCSDTSVIEVKCSRCDSLIAYPSPKEAYIVIDGKPNIVYSRESRQEDVLQK